MCGGLNKMDLDKKEDIEIGNMDMNIGNNVELENNQVFTNPQKSYTIAQRWVNQYFPQKVVFFKLFICISVKMCIFLCL